MKRSSKKKSELGSLVNFLGGALVGIGALYLNRKKIAKYFQQETLCKEPTPQTTETPDSEIEAFLCPISQELMRDPVVTPYGHCYERKSIEDWLEKSNSCPLTGKKLSKEDLIPNYSMKNAIEQYLGVKSK